MTYNIHFVKARRPWRCSHCTGVIPAQDHYVSGKPPTQGVAGCLKYHLTCSTYVKHRNGKTLYVLAMLKDREKGSLSPPALRKVNA